MVNQQHQHLNKSDNHVGNRETHTPISYSKGKQHFNKKIICYARKRIGHKAYQCKNKNRNRERSSLAGDSTFSVNEKWHVSTGKWILDSGATSHMCADKEKFVEMTQLFDTTVNLANNEVTKVDGKGTVYLHSEFGSIKLINVLYVPDIRINLLSVNRITENNYKVQFLRNKAFTFNSKNEVVLCAKKFHGLYEVCERIPSDQTHIATENNELLLWHKRLGHINLQSLSDMIKNKKIVGVKNFNLKHEPASRCEICLRGKQTRLPFLSKSQNICKQPLEIIHSDVCGPIKIKSLGGAKYFLTFIDDATRWCTVYFMQRKDEVLKYFKEYKTELENLEDKKIKILRTDNGKEYVNNEFSSYLRSAGIVHQLTVEYTPQQNAVAERMNRTLVEMAR